MVAKNASMDGFGLSGWRAAASSARNAPCPRMPTYVSTSIRMRASEAGTTAAPKPASTKVRMVGNQDDALLAWAADWHKRIAPDAVG